MRLELIFEVSPDPYAIVVGSIFDVNMGHNECHDAPTLHHRKILPIAIVATYIFSHRLFECRRDTFANIPWEKGEKPESSLILSDLASNVSGTNSSALS